MANLADTISTSAMLSACLASVRRALQQTHAALARHDGARTDTLKAFFGIEPETNRHDIMTVDVPHSGAPLPSIADALSRRRDIFGAHAAEVDHG